MTTDRAIVDPATTDRAATHQAETSMRNVIDTYTTAATQTHDETLRESSAFALGMFKYIDEHHIRTRHQRNPAEAGQLKTAHARLPHIDKFIETADADTLHLIIDGMMTAFERYHPRHESHYAPGTDTLINLRHDHDDERHLDEPGRQDELRHIHNLVLESRWIECFENFTQNANPALRADTAFQIGVLRYISERGLRLSDFNSPRSRELGRDAQDDIEVLDRMIETADSDQLRHIIRGLTPFIRP